MSPRFSLIVPAYNEALLLPRLLDSLEVARAAFGPPEAVELIVADNGSTDETAAIATARGCQVVPVAKRVIAAARNGGAGVATGEVVAFVDADSRVHPRTFVEIDRVLSGGGVVGGATGVRLERWSLGIVFTWMLIVPLVVAMRMDTGVVFCRREDFVSIGGYDERRLVGEDVAFLLALRRLGRTRGEHLVRVRRAKAIASTRKFDEFGDWHYFPLIVEGLRHLLGGRPTEFTDRYWYKPKR